MPRGVPKKHSTIKLPKRVAAEKLILQQIGQDNLDYIIAHYNKQKRSITAEITGIPKLMLNHYYCLLRIGGDVA